MIENEEFEDEEFEDIPIDEMTDEQLEIWLDFQPFYFRWAKSIGIVWGFLSNIKNSIYDLILIVVYKFIMTSFYRYMHIGVMIFCAIIHWFFMFGQEDIKIIDGKDEHIIFHLPIL